MNSRIKTWHKGLALTLPLIALLAGCNRGEKVEEPQTHALATYVSAPWEALPSVSDADLLAGFGSWRSACTRLKADATWARPARQRPMCRKPHRMYAIS